MYVGDVQSQAPASSYDAVLTELCSVLFASLPRSDQRRRGVEYVRGLLEAEGRKSIRNIAALVGGSAAEQGLHHFISSSTWAWGPMRYALAQYLARNAPPQAWVVRPMVIPKAGRYSVGVERRFFPTVGRVVNAQQAVGVWAASDELSSPVNWRLYLSPAWLDDGLRRNRVSIPDAVCRETLDDCAITAYLETMSRGELPIRPVVLDTPETDALTMVHKFRTAGVPLLARISSALRLTIVDSALAGYGADTLSAHQIMVAARGTRRPAMWAHHSSESAGPISLAATVRVAMPDRSKEARHTRRDELLLLGVGQIGKSWPTELWLTDLANAQPTALLRLSRLTHRVDRDFAEITERVGIRDFAGRSFDGWHRHVTLACAAHAIAALTNTAVRKLAHVS